MDSTLGPSDAMLIALPILPGKEEAWRRFAQEIKEIHPKEYGESRQRLGIRRESTHIAAATKVHIAIVTIESDEPNQVLARLSHSAHPFDHWFRKQVLELHGIDITTPALIPLPEMICTWRAPGRDWED